MKFTKLIAIILCISMLAVAFVGCNGGNDPVVEEPTTNEQPPVVDDTKKETMVKKTFVSFTSQTSAAIWGREISEYSVMAGRFTIKEGYLDQLNVFMSTLGDITLSLYKWNKDYETTVAGTPIKQKVFLKSDLSSFEANNCYNMELQFEDNEVGKGNYLYVLSHVEGSKNNASVFVSNSWTNKTLPKEYEQYNLVTYINGKKATNEVAYSSFVVKTEVEKVDKGAIPTDKIDDNVAKVILLGGQSNAVGVSLNSELQKNVSAAKYNEYLNGYSNVQIMYNNCSGNVSFSFTNTKLGQGVDNHYFGPELGLAEYLSENFPDEKFYIIKYAMGGSVLETQWYNAKAGTPLELLCGLENFAKQGLAALEAQGLEPQIVGFVWNQGESDSITLPQASRYYANQAGLVDYVRTIFADYACARGIGFFDAGIVSNLWPAYAYTNIQKYDYSLTSPINFYIETTDYPDINTLKENNDMAHYDSLAMIKLGHLYGAEIEKFLK